MNYKILTALGVFSTLALTSNQSLAEVQSPPPPVRAKKPAESSNAESAKIAVADKKVAESPNAQSAKIAIVVNKDVITYQDIQDRAQLILMTSGVENTPEMLKTVMQQVKRSLIDEKVQLQAAKLQKVFVADADVDAALENIAKDNQMTVDQKPPL